MPWGVTGGALNDHRAVAEDVVVALMDEGGLAVSQRHVGGGLCNAGGFFLEYEVGFVLLHYPGGLGKCIGSVMVVRARDKLIRKANSRVQQGEQ